MVRMPVWGENGRCSSLSLVLTTSPAPSHRRQPLRWHQCLGAAPFLPHPPRSRRSHRRPRLHPRLASAAGILRDRGSPQWLSPGRAADPPAAARRQGVCAVQLDRHLLLAARAEPRVRRHPGQELQLDRRRRLERGPGRQRPRQVGRRHHSPLPEPPHPGGPDRRGRCPRHQGTLPFRPCGVLLV